MSLLFAGVATFSSGSAWAEAEADTNAPEAINVGVALEALRDVKLQEAELGKGSRVMVAGVARTREGQITSVDLELPDGYVVSKVAFVTVVRAFRVVDEG